MLDVLRRANGLAELHTARRVNSFDERGAKGVAPRLILFEAGPALDAREFNTTRLRYAVHPKAISAVLRT